MICSRRTAAQFLQMSYLSHTMHLYRGPVTGFSPHSAQVMLGCQPAVSQPPVNTWNLVIDPRCARKLSCSVWTAVTVPYSNWLQQSPRREFSTSVAMHGRGFIATNFGHGFMTSRKMCFGGWLFVVVTHLKHKSKSEQLRHLYLQQPEGWVARCTGSVYVLKYIFWRS